MYILHSSMSVPNYMVSLIISHSSISSFITLVLSLYYHNRNQSIHSLLHSLSLSLPIMSAAASFPTVYASEQELAATDRQRERYNEHNISEEIKGTQQLATNTIFATSGFGKTQGIRAIAKDLQPRWQDVLSRPSYPKNGAPITIYDQTTGQLSLQSTQAQPSKQSNHALGPQHIVNSSQLSSLPDAPHRQSWSNQVSG